MHLWHSLHHCPKLLFLILVLRRAKLNGCCRATKMNLCLLSFRALIGMFSSGRAPYFKKIPGNLSSCTVSGCSNQPQFPSLVPSVSAVSAEEQWGSDVDPWIRPVGQHPWHLWCRRLISLVGPPFFGTAEKLVSHQFTLIATQWHNKPTIIFGFNSSVSRFWWWCFPLPGGSTPIFGDQSLERPPSCETMRPA